VLRGEPVIREGVAIPRAAPPLNRVPILQPLRCFIGELPAPGVYAHPLAVRPGRQRYTLRPRSLSDFCINIRIIGARSRQGCRGARRNLAETMWYTRFLGLISQARNPTMTDGWRHGIRRGTNGRGGRVFDRENAVCKLTSPRAVSLPLPHHARGLFLRNSSA
jgi:hypothetical protein